MQYATPYHRPDFYDEPSTQFRKRGSTPGYSDIYQMIAVA
jgi:hypothetical protein